ncbi:rRNA maturation RNase YbeY [Tunturibacter empetritectus]|uniref:Endoribonuclease YbeY n=1 Tax=Tunturiibacter empetritectus TaxID=3069691 RepID=A0A7W8MSR0_9BACT|nr:rRNA maturation RNase YbeY [Edaphobacter lichenicola]MBB5318958.1 putative rRNA maturation factor [Edaphobacter lichenicola]
MITIEPAAGLEATLSRSSLTDFLKRARLALGLRGEVEVLLADDPTLRRLNKSFRGKNKPTDVLSFPTPAEIAHLHAGDLAISLETAALQAASYGHSLRDEVKILLLHGLLHLSGLDHETDNGEMATREAALRRQLRLTTNSLTERATKLPQKSSSHTAKKKPSSPKKVPAASKKSPSIRPIKKAGMPNKKTARGSK